MAGRILILSASVGAGHLRAAQALEETFREVAPGAMVRNVDVLELTNRTFRKLYSEAYLKLMNTFPHALGYLYEALDRKPRRENSRRDRLRTLVDRLNLKRLEKLFGAEPWDIVVNTHFLPAEIVAGLRRSGRFHREQVTVTTDFDTHRMWVHEPTDHYFTATEEGAAYLRPFGVPAERVTTTGIPIVPTFAKPMDRAELREVHGLAGDRPVLLQLSGGFGVGPVEEIYRQVLSVEAPLQVVVVCGRNEELQTTLQEVEVPSRHRSLVVGYTRVMHEFMALADVVLTKPGGLTTSEVLASGAAMAIMNPIPGQEALNSDYLLENQAATKIQHLALVGHKLSRLLDDPERLVALKAGARRLGRPQAAHAVVEHVLARLDR